MRHHRPRRHRRRPGRRRGGRGTPARLMTQREALTALGVDAARPPLDLASADPAGYVRALAAATKAAELIDPDGLGGHFWLLQPVVVPARMPGARMADMAITDRDAEITVGTGTGLETADMVLNIGPQHPSTHGVLRLRLVLDGERVVSAEPIVGLHAPRRREAVRGPRLPADHRAGQPARLAVRLRQRTRRGARGRTAHGHGGARAGGLAAYRAGRAQPGAQPPDVPRLVPAGDRRRHADLLRLPGAGDDPGGAWRRSPAAGCTTCSTGSAG